MLAPCNSSSVSCHNTSFVVSHQEDLHSLPRLLSQTLAQAMLLALARRMTLLLLALALALLALALARRMTLQQPMKSWTWQQPLQRYIQDPWWQLQTLPLQRPPRKSLLRVPRRVARRRPLRARKGLLPEEEEEEEEEEEVHTQ
jgi:hypothetical protein